MSRSASQPLGPSSNNLLSWIAFLLSVAALYLAKEVLIPVALAMLFAFLLTPATKLLEKAKSGRAMAVLVVLSLSLGVVGGVSWIVSTQLLDVVNQLPSYKENIKRKLDTVHGRPGGLLNKTTASVQELTKEITKEITAPPPKQPVAVLREPAKGPKSNSSPLGQRPIPVEVIEPAPSVLQTLRDILGPLVAPLGTVFMVVLFTAFILIKREDLRDRLIRLVAQGHLSVMTQAMDDAGQRLSRYLMMLFVVNATFGVCIATGLYFIGVPNALLWGALAGSLRFVPYVGPLIAGVLPFLLTLAVFHDWTAPMLTFGLFLVIEITIANFVEPWLYGAHTGISSLAILAAAVFLAVLWGPLGLILSTPLTVCLAVIGSYVPGLKFLHILLGDEPVLAPDVQFYQRLLAMDQIEAKTVCEAFLKGRPLIELYDEVIIPALAMAERDRHQGLLDLAKEVFIVQSVNELIVDLGEESTNSEDALHTDTRAPGDASKPSIENRAKTEVVCVAANDQSDEITATMLCQVLERAGYRTVSLPASDSPHELFDEISIHGAEIVCVCALPPFALLHARKLAKSLRASFPSVKIIVGIWSLAEVSAGVQQRLGKAFTDRVVNTLMHALQELDSVTEAHSPGGPAVVFPTGALSPAKLDNPLAT